MMHGPMRGPVRALAVALAVGLALGGPAPVAAQTVSGGTGATPDALRHIQQVEPRTGPPGTQVRIYSENMPPQGKVLVGVGAIGVGFEVLGEGDQGAWGDVRARVRIPASATSDRPIRIIFLNGLFSPFGLSDPFHVTDERGLVQREGELSGSGVDCPLVLADGHGESYELRGEVEGLLPGRTVVVEGRWSPDGCAEGGSLAVTGIVPPETAPPTPGSGSGPEA